MSAKRTDKRPFVTCHHCSGKGILPLYEDLHRTLCAIQQLSAGTVNQVHACLGDRISTTAINNRLEALRKLGLIQRERVGKTYIYSAAR